MELSRGLIQKMFDLRKPRNRQEFGTFLGICIRIIPNQYCQYDILRELQAYGRATGQEFEKDEFENAKSEKSSGTNLGGESMGY